MNNGGWGVSREKQGIIAHSSLLIRPPARSQGHSHTPTISLFYLPNRLLKNFFREKLVFLEKIPHNII
jgi:hypothetical protein